MSDAYPSLRLAVLPASDLERSISFYTAALGMTVERRGSLPQVTEASLAFPGGGAGILLVETRHASGEPRGLANRVVIDAPDIESLASRVTAAGYALERP